MKSDQGFRQWRRWKTEDQGTGRQGKLNKVTDHQIWSRLKGNKPEKKEVRSGFPITKVDEDWRSSNLNRVTNQVCSRPNDRKPDVSDQEIWSRPEAKEPEQGYQTKVWSRLNKNLEGHAGRSSLLFKASSRLRKKSDEHECQKVLSKVWWRLPDGAGKNSSLNELEGKEALSMLIYWKVGEDLWSIRKAMKLCCPRKLTKVIVWESWRDCFSRKMIKTED